MIFKEIYSVLFFYFGDIKIKNLLRYMNNYSFFKNRSKNIILYTLSIFDP